MRMTTPSLTILAGLVLLGSLVVVANRASIAAGRDETARAAAAILEARRNPGERLY